MCVIIPQMNRNVIFDPGHLLCKLQYTLLIHSESRFFFIHIFEEKIFSIIFFSLFLYTIEKNHDKGSISKLGSF